MQINDKTSISIGLMIVLAGGITWLTALWASNNANSAAIASLSVSRDKEWHALEEIRERLIRIEEHLSDEKSHPAR